ncbi:MAG: hypothetical protein FWC39_01160 [Bacteroidetes bacterium]|nr:hypothetical protein [Bacteroidota bacterium]
MKIDGYKSVYEKASGKLSDISRNIALAGFALIWIFTKTDTQTIIPKELILPAIFLVVSLTCDILQYAYKTIVWAIIFRCKEKEIKRKRWKQDKEFKHSPALNIVTWVFFCVKIVLVLLAYSLILKFLIRTII